MLKILNSLMRIRIRYGKISIRDPELTSRNTESTVLYFNEFYHIGLSFFTIFTQRFKNDPFSFRGFEIRSKRLRIGIYFLKFSLNSLSFSPRT